MCITVFHISPEPLLEPLLLIVYLINSLIGKINLSVISRRRVSIKITRYASLLTAVYLRRRHRHRRGGLVFPSALHQTYVAGPSALLTQT